MNHVGAGIMKLAATPAKKDYANRVSDLGLVARGNQVSRECASESTNSMRQERHEEMPRLEKVHPLAQALCAAQIHTRRRRNERRAERDDRHVHHPANGDSGEEGDHISQDLGMRRFS